MSNQECSIDILMATYNGERYLSEQIQSLLNQTYAQIHLIIRDDCSKDNTPFLLAEYAKNNPERITLLHGNRQLGIKGNFSELMKHASSPYVMFCDQDDVWLPTKVAKTLHQIKHLEKLHGKDSPLLVHTDLAVVRHDLSLICNSFWQYTKLVPKRSHQLNRLLVQNVVTGCSMMINRPLLELAYPIPSEAMMHDWWIAIVASAFGSISAIKESTLLYRQHGQNSLGAKKFLSLSHLKNGLKKLLLKDEKRFNQAAVFFERFQEILGYPHREIVDVYRTLPKRSWLAKRTLLFKYQFFRNGLIRNAAAFFWGI